MPHAAQKSHTMPARNFRRPRRRRGARSGGSAGSSAATAGSDFRIAARLRALGSALLVASSTMPANKFWLVGLAVAAAKEAPSAVKALDSKELAGKPILEKVETSLTAVKPTAQFQPAKEILGAVKPTLTMMGDIEGAVKPLAPYAKVGVKMRVEYKARDGKAAEMTWLAVSKAFVKMAGVDPSRVTVAASSGSPSSRIAATCAARSSASVSVDASAASPSARVSMLPSSTPASSRIAAACAASSSASVSVREASAIAGEGARWRSRRSVHGVPLCTAIQR